MLIEFDENNEIILPKYFIRCLVIVIILFIIENAFLILNNVIHF